MGTLQCGKTKTQNRKDSGERSITQECNIGAQDRGKPRSRASPRALPASLLRGPCTYLHKPFSSKPKTPKMQKNTRENAEHNLRSRLFNINYPVAPSLCYAFFLWVFAIFWPNRPRDAGTCRARKHCKLRYFRPKTGRSTPSPEALC